MKILFAIKALDDVQGGAERVLADITSGLAERDHNVAVLSFDQPMGKSFYPLNRKVKRIPLGIGDVKRKATFLEVISRMIAIRKAAIRMQPDIVIAFSYKRRFSIPLVDEVFGDDPDMRWISYYMRPDDSGEHPVSKSRKFKRLQLIDLYFKIRHQDIAQHFGR